MMSDQHDDIAIKVSNLHKTFRIPFDGGMNLKQRIVNFTRGRKGYRDFSPLNGVDFEIKKGEFFGIVGRNGSGKSTLLKNIAGIYTPDEGYVKVNGTLVPFIELGVGFNPELTGRENVYLNGALLGFSRQEMTDMYDEIVDFAELHDFMDERLKNYSSGMQVRLAFSIAIRAQGDILLLDEVLAVGDSAFQQKCFSYFHTLRRNKKTVILVTHSMSAVQKFCDRALLLERGVVKKIGTSAEISELYDDLFIEDSNKSQQPKKSSEKSLDKQWRANVNVSIISNDEEVSTVKYNDWFTVRLEVSTNSFIEDGNVGINLRDERDNIVFSMDTKLYKGGFSIKPGESLTACVDILNKYTNGRYFVDVHLVDESKSEDSILFKARHLVEYNSSGVINHSHSMFHPDMRVRIEQ